jgi:hypothetical protein
MPMEKMEFWLENGSLIDRPVTPSGEPIAERTIWQTRDVVKVETSPTGTTMTWVMFAANWASLFFAREWLSTLPAPYTLEFFNLGWFSEKCSSLEEVANRIDVLLSKSDIRFSARVFTEERDVNKRSALPEIRMAQEAGEVPDYKSVICAVDFDLERTTVASVGEESALANVWGLSPVSYPVLSGHSYDRIVSRSYFEVARSGRPHHDHVLAAMTKPNGDVHWFGYQRLIVPGHSRINGHPTVNILSEVGPVDIKLL